MPARARILAALLLTVALAALGAGSARADGDPASDFLYFDDIFVSYSKPAVEIAAAFKDEVAKANAAGYRIKVAVIATPTDLGSVPSLFNQPQEYARFLAAELSSFYKDRLLIVMPSGFGIYNNGAPTDEESAVLAGVKIGGPDPDSLTGAATEAVRKLVTGERPQPPQDTVPPAVKALRASGKRGKLVKLRYAVSDDSGTSKEIVRVYGPNLFLYATKATRASGVTPGTVRAVSWRIPKRIVQASLRFCVLARDPTGNQSRPSCAPIRLL